MIAVATLSIMMRALLLLFWVLRACQCQEEDCAAPWTKTFLDSIWKEAPSLRLESAWTTSPLFFPKQDTSHESFMNDLIQRGSSTHEQQSLQQVFQLVLKAIQRVKLQVESDIGDVLDRLLKRVNLLQIFFYMDYEESTKDAVWKRRQHRFLPSVSVKDGDLLGDALFLSHLSYVDSCAILEDNLKAVQQGSFLLRNCTTQSQPNQPAHFLAVRRLSPPTLWSSPPLEVLLVVRGSKQVGDFLSDAMFAGTAYQGGLAHDGILSSARWLVDLYQDDLEYLLGATGRTNMNLWLVGHSLGAGTVALAAMEWKSRELKWLKPSCIGFGTPSVVSTDLSLQYQDVVTTVVNDADCVPRMSGGSVLRAIHRVAYHNWTDLALADYDHLLEYLRRTNPIFEAEWIHGMGGNLREWIGRRYDETVGPYLDELAQLNMSASKAMSDRLIPPGRCIHIYRDGVAWQASHTPCDFFRELDVVRNMIEDHLIPPGYYTGLLSWMREQKGNASWRFDHDLMQLPVFPFA